MSKIPITQTNRIRQLMPQLKIDMLSIINISQFHIECPYQKNQSWEEAISITLQFLRQHMEYRNRIIILAYSFYLGQLLNQVQRKEWKTYVQQYNVSNAGYYYKGTIRVYQIFKENFEQIYRTSTMSLYLLEGMSVNDFHNDLLPFVKDISKVAQQVEL